MLVATEPSHSDWLAGEIVAGLELARQSDHHVIPIIQEEIPDWILPALRTRQGLTFPTGDPTQVVDDLATRYGPAPQRPETDVDPHTRLSTLLTRKAGLEFQGSDVTRVNAELRALHQELRGRVLRAGDVLGERYELLGELGRGGVRGRLVGLGPHPPPGGGRQGPARREVGGPRGPAPVLPGSL